MRPEIIKEKIPGIDLSRLGEEPTDEQIWEENDGFAHFKVTRHELNHGIKESFTMIGLSISGKPEDRARIQKEFTIAMGKQPDVSETVELENYSIGFLIWHLDS
ncbi:MAG TPA: hypothetical protein VII94_02125, partial [Candidatus Saccharimonadales bacterium]